jgi:hypothetical protein
MLRFCTFRFHASPGFTFQFRTATGVPAIARDRECREMVANAAFCEMLGIAPETNPSKTGVHADQAPFRVKENGVEVAPENLPVQTAAREGISVNSSCQIVRDDGKTVIIINLLLGAQAGAAANAPWRAAFGKPAAEKVRFCDDTWFQTETR